MSQSKRIKIKHMHFGYPVHDGERVQDFYDTTKHRFLYVYLYDDGKVLVENAKTGDKTYTTLNNVKWWREYEPTKKASPASK